MTNSASQFWPETDNNLQKYHLFNVKEWSVKITKHINSIIVFRVERKGGSVTQKKKKKKEKKGGSGKRKKKWWRLEITLWANHTLRMGNGYNIFPHLFLSPLFSIYFFEVWCWVFYIGWPKNVLVLEIQKYLNYVLLSEMHLVNGIVVFRVSKPSTIGYGLSLMSSNVSYQVWSHWKNEC